MSLVAYESSSDEESNQDDDEQEQKNISNHDAPAIENSNSELNNGNISDEEEYHSVAVELNQLKKIPLKLPAPVKTSTYSFVDNEEKFNTPQFSQLPVPKTAKHDKTNAIIEEDDEFLHKKAIPMENIEKEKPPPAPHAKGRVKITIPSLKEFHDVNKKCSNMEITPNTSKKPSKGSSLLSILPPAKSERNFSRPLASSEPSSSLDVKTSSFLIPDTVKNRRPALNTENVEKSNIKKPFPANKLEPKLVECSDDSDGDDDDGSGNESSEDFFSLNSKQKLPEVSLNEINQLVAKRAAQIAESSKRDLEFHRESSTKNQIDGVIEDEPMEEQLDESAIQALVGNRSKRRKKNDENIHVVNISSDQVHPSREEWMRTALTAATSYQPTGVLVDEEPASGTRRKHQITYLAHRALANEAELQAMWATNRQNRRATQSKYGF